MEELKTILVQSLKDVLTPPWGSAIGTQILLQRNKAIF